MTTNTDDFTTLRERREAREDEIEEAAQARVRAIQEAVAPERAQAVAALAELRALRASDGPRLERALAEFASPTYAQMTGAVSEGVTEALRGVRKALASLDGEAPARPIS